MKPQSIVILMNQKLIQEVFSTLKKGEFIRLAWEDENEKFHKTGTQNYEQFISKVDELKSFPYIASIWFTPNPSNSPSSHTQDDITRAHWVYVDIDDVSPEEFLQKYDYIKPTYTVATGHGVQLYWKLKRPIAIPNEQWQAIENAIKRKFHGEKGESCSLLRVPDTPNRKHLIEKHRKKGYTVETKCEVIGFCDEEYDLDDFIEAGLDIDNQPTEIVTSPTAKRSLDDLKRIRQYCPAINEAFLSIENNKGNEKTIGHYKRLAVASMIKHTIDDEKYLLKLFSKVSDFDPQKTLKYYRSLDKWPFTCAKLQEKELCSETCQLMTDLNKKSPIVFAYRSGVQLKTTDTLLNETENDSSFKELMKRVKSIENPVNQEKLISKVIAETGINKSSINRYMKKIKVRDDIKSYIVNGEVDPVKAAIYIIRQYQLMRYQQDFYKYQDGIWELMPQEEVESLIHHEIKQYSDNHTISEVINAVKREALIKPNTVDKAQGKYWIAASNGLLDAETKALRDFTQEDYRFIKMNAKYNAAADCPVFKEFLRELFMYDTDAADKRKLVQEIFGYLLIPDYSLIKKMFYFYGPKANNGKSSLIEIIRSVMGPGYFDSVPMDKLNGFLLKRLQGKHANVVGDQDAYTKVPDGILKQLIGGMDEITADVKYKDAITFTNYARLIFAVNKLPFSEAKDEGYFTRAVILTFNNQFLINPDRKDHRQMKADVEKIQYIKDNEKEGILNWMLEGLSRLLANKKLTIPTSSESAVKDYKTNNNSILLFVGDNCQLGPTFQVSQSELYTNYRGWCQDQGFKGYANSVTFYDLLEREYKVVRQRTKNSRRLVGIKLT